LLLELHDGIAITLSEFLHFPRQHVIHLQHNIIILAHVLIMLSLCQENACVLVVATIHFILDHLIKIFIRIIVFERGPYLLVALVFLFPMPNLWDQTSFKVLISGLEIMLFSGVGFVSHKHYFHQLLHHLHHQVELVLRGSRSRWLCISLGFLPTSVEALFGISQHHQVYLNFDCITHHGV
jgi:hypothetical protein